MLLWVHEPTGCTHDLGKLYGRDAKGKGMSVGKDKGLIFELRLDRHRKYAEKFISASTNKICDIGCGDGFFISNIKRLYKEKICHAADFNSTPPNSIKDKSEFEVIYWQTNLLLDSHEKYDLIFARHVVEHTPDAKEFVSQLANMLNPNGAIVIEVPNFESIWRILFKKNWSLLGINRREGPVHYSHFTRSSINKIFENEFQINFFDTSMNVLGPSILNQMTNYSSDHSFSLFSVLFYPFQKLAELCLKSPSVLLFSLRKKLDHDYNLACIHVDRGSNPQFSVETIKINCRAANSLWA